MQPKKRQPTHPGQILQEEFLAPAKLTQTALAKHLGGTWTQAKISEIVTGRRGISERIALDLADAFGTSPRFWLNLQNQYDLWLAQKNHKRIERINFRDVSDSDDDALEG